MATNIYRVGDYVYFESSTSLPFLIRRIEELNKNPSGSVEAKVMCFYRRRDLPNSLIQLADKHQVSLDEDKITNNSNTAPTNADRDTLDSEERHRIKHRELFLSRQVETLPATHIKGKCSVTLLNETESLISYLNMDDTFFYCLVFDPTQKTLLADKGEIRVGSRYQTDIPLLLKGNEIDARNSNELETLMWTPQHNLTDRKIDQFLVVSRSVGTFARALDCSSSVKQPSLHMSAAAASRDVTLFHAMDILHKHNYSVEESMCSLVPLTGPVLCRDEIEDWSASEANLFEEALEKYGKDFNDIRQDFLPWKTLKQIVEYYYMWKTTDRYVQQKRVKAVEAESKLKQVYIPIYTKTNSSISSGKSGILNGSMNGVADASNGKPCESCSATTSPQWYPWSSHGLGRLCQTCWNYWKKYGGLKVATRLVDNEAETAVVKKKSINEVFSEEEKVDETSNQQSHKCSIVSCGKDFKLKSHLARHYAQVHGIAIRSGSPRPIMKTRTAFYLHTNRLTRLSRTLCKSLINSKRAARQPSYAINTQMVRNEFTIHLAGKSATEIKALQVCTKKNRTGVTKIANKLGSPGLGPHEWLILTPKDDLPKPDRVAFPKPPRAPDGSLMYERVPNKVVDKKEDLSITTPLIRKRVHGHLNGSGAASFIGPPAKRPNKDPMPSHCPSPEQFAALMAASGQPLARHQLNGKPKIAQMVRTVSGRKQVISWMDAPDDVYFRVNESSKKARKVFAVVDLRRAARKPWRKLPVKTSTSTANSLQVVILD